MNSRTGLSVLCSSTSAAGAGRRLLRSPGQEEQPHPHTAQNRARERQLELLCHTDRQERGGTFTLPGKGPKRDRTKTELHRGATRRGRINHPKRGGERRRTSARTDGGEDRSFLQAGEVKPGLALPRGTRPPARSLRSRCPCATGPSRLHPLLFALFTALCLNLRQTSQVSQTTTTSKEVLRRGGTNGEYNTKGKDKRWAREERR